MKMGIFVNISVKVVALGCCVSCMYVYVICDMHMYICICTYVYMLITYCGICMHYEYVYICIYIGKKRFSNNTVIILV